ncbi:MAG: 50S ribosomal protein L2 [Candidatus Sungbacteria bacterium]|nr:50S ribosomal protein L2 [Candidatus Sungbacteria bacterium]
MKKYSPTSPARRQAQSIDYRAILTRSHPEESLTRGFHSAAGRNAQGRITVRHKGGGVKRLWREIDFQYDKHDVPGRIASLEYDPNRTSFIALVVYKDGEKRYVLAPQGSAVGKMILASETASIEIGNRTMLGRIPVGTMVYNVEMRRGGGAQAVRSAGVGAVVLAQEGALTHLKLPSGEIRAVQSFCWASIGVLSNPEHAFVTIGGAGRNRRRGIRPTVRGSAMNPVDHPHGGGEGRALIGRRRGPATPWGKPARGVKTRKKNKWSNKFIVSRRKK